MESIQQHEESGINGKIRMELIYSGAIGSTDIASANAYMGGV